MKSFPLVIAELEARANKAARLNVETGASQPIKFEFSSGCQDISSTIDLPEESFVNVLYFLDGHELINASLVSKVWLSVTRLPVVWEDGLDMSRLNDKKSFTMSGLVKLLKEPQFASLKALAMPNKVKLGQSGVKQMAKALPHLEMLDLTNTKAKDKDLLDVIEHFPSLHSLRIDTWNATSFGIAQAVRAIGGHLLELRIKADIGRFGTYGMEVIASSCPNLGYFAYKNNHYYYSDSDHQYFSQAVTGDDIVTLVRSCRRLETLELINSSRHVKQHSFVQIAELVANDLEGHALRNIVGYGLSPRGAEWFDIRELLSKYTFLNVKDEYYSSKLGKGVVFWSKYERKERGSINYTD